MRRLCTKNDASAKQHGSRRKNHASECGENWVFFCWSQCNVGANIKTSRTARICCRFRSIDADAEKHLSSRATKMVTLCWVAFTTHLVFFSLDTSHWHPSTCRRQKVCSDKLDILWRSRNSTVVCTANENAHDCNLFVTVQVLEETLAVLAW